MEPIKKLSPNVLSESPTISPLSRTFTGLSVCAVSAWTLENARLPLPEHTYPQQIVVCLLAGYLALDLYYNYNHNKDEPKSSTATLSLDILQLEDIMTLILLVSILILNGNDYSELENCNGLFYALIAKTALKLVWQNASFPRRQHQKQEQQQQRHIQQLSDKVIAKSSEQFQRESLLWWIHGKGYDLDDFVRRHPGGTEAILLGKGRDCTALFESYHAFTQPHAKAVLEKYATQSRKPQQSSNNENDEDQFYTVLKDRVMATLKEKGVDPIRDRGATWSRTLYYLLVFCGWIATGFAHVTVRMYY
jgi:cytochrome b involved in lipid metabolism